MNFPYETMVSPYRLNDKVTLKNRITFPNGQHGLVQGPETFPSEGVFAEIADLCSSGASLISFNTYDVHGGGSRGDRSIPEDQTKSHIPIYNYKDPSVQNYLSQLAQTVHMQGSKILARISPAFPKGYTYGGGDARSLLPLPEGVSYARPSGGSQKLTMEQMKARIAPKEMLQSVIDDMVRMLVHYKAWGWDGMDFRADRYIDADTNLRTDEYGGEIENRGRFLHELFLAVKKACGEDFIIEVALPGQDEHGHDGELRHGYTLDETIRFAKLIEDSVDIIQLRHETGTAYHPTGYNSRPGDHATVLSYCRALKDAGIRCTISANGGFNDPDDMEAALRSGDCDLISAARAFIAEPEFMRKLFSNGEEKPTPCIMCNKCHGIYQPPWLSFCTVNPKSCLSHRLPATIKPVQRTKKVAVIGAGAIGMRAACFASERGHDVTLYEKSDYLGGKLKYADMYSFKWPLKRYRLWLIDELGRRNVKVHLNCEPTPDELRAARYDAIIACTGSHEKRPDIPGADLEGVWTGEDVYESRAVIGEKVVVIGGGEVATETAMHLAEMGKDVTIITRSDILMKKEVRSLGPHEQFQEIIPELGYGGTTSAWSIYDNLHVVLNAKTINVTTDSVTYVRDGNEVTIKCDCVVVNGGYKGNVEEALKYAGCAPEFYLAGDVEEDVCGNIQQGNISAFGKANLL